MQFIYSSLQVSHVHRMVIRLSDLVFPIILFSSMDTRLQEMRFNFFAIETSRWLMFEKSDDFRQIIAKIFNKKYFYFKHEIYIYTRYF